MGATAITERGMAATAAAIEVGAMKRNIIVVSSVVMFLIIGAMYIEAQRILSRDCIMADEGKACEAHRSPLNLYFILAFIANSVVLGFSLASLRITRKISIDRLEGDEKRVVEYILEKGPAYQGVIAKELGISKVRMTRILDRLEAKGLVERKRHGMTNLVVLKYGGGE